MSKVLTLPEISLYKKYVVGPVVLLKEEYIDILCKRTYEELYHIIKNEQLENQLIDEFYSFLRGNTLQVNDFIFSDIVEVSDAISEIYDTKSYASYIIVKTIVQQRLNDLLVYSCGHLPVNKYLIGYSPTIGNVQPPDPIKIYTARQLSNFLIPPCSYKKADYVLTGPNIYYILNAKPMCVDIEIMT